MPVYMVIEAREIADPVTYMDYVSKVPITVARFGGKYLCREGKTEVISGDWNPGRLILLEFESKEHSRFGGTQRSTAPSLRSGKGRRR